MMLDEPFYFLAVHCRSHSDQPQALPQPADRTGGYSEAEMGPRVQGNSRLGRWLYEPPGTYNCKKKKEISSLSIFFVK